MSPGLELWQKISLEKREIERGKKAILWKKLALKKTNFVVKLFDGASPTFKLNYRIVTMCDEAMHHQVILDFQRQNFFYRIASRRVEDNIFLSVFYFQFGWPVLILQAIYYHLSLSLLSLLVVPFVICEPLKAFFRGSYSRLFYCTVLSEKLLVKVCKRKLLSDKTLY